MNKEYRNLEALINELEKSSWLEISPIESIEVLFSANNEIDAYTDPYTEYLIIIGKTSLNGRHYGTRRKIDKRKARENLYELAYEARRDIIIELKAMIVAKEFDTGYSL